MHSITVFGLNYLWAKNFQDIPGTTGQWKIEKYQITNFHWSV